MAVQTEVFKTSDISGDRMTDEQSVNVAIREYPGIDGSKQIDATKEELKALKTIANVIALEYRYADGTSEEVYVTKTELDKVISPEVIEKADSLHGRRKGFSPTTR